jgi:hypothetical protein
VRLLGGFPADAVREVPANAELTPSAAYFVGALRSDVSGTSLGEGGRAGLGAKDVGAGRCTRPFSSLSKWQAVNTIPAKLTPSVTAVTPPSAREARRSESRVVGAHCMRPLNQ